MKRKGIIALALLFTLGASGTAVGHCEKDDSFIVPAYPRGNVRMTDIGRYRIDVGDEFKTPGKLVFKRGRKVLFEAKFDPKSFSVREPIPEKVKKALKPGWQVTWGFYPKKGKPVTTKFKVVRANSRLKKRLKQLEERMKGQPELAVRQLRAQLYLNKKLYLAAYLEGRRALELSKGSFVPPTQALTVMQSAAQRMRLRKSPIWHEIEAEIVHESERVKERQRKARPANRKR